MKRLTAKIIQNGPLTDKEACVLRYLSMGYYRPEIALHLHRTLSTVSKHVENIAIKLDAHGSTEIVLVAEKMGLVEITITEYRYQNLMLILLIIGQLISPNLGRRPPQTQRPAIRLVRTSRQ